MLDDMDSDTEMFTAELDETRPDTSDVLAVLGPQSIDLAEFASAIPPLPEFNLDIICEIMSFG